MPTTTTNAVRYDVREDVAFLTLDAPPVNVLSGAMMDELARGIARAQSDRSLKALVLESATRAFSAGADVGEHRPEAAPAMIAAFSRLFAAFGALDLPVVMAVDGAALGAGFELVMMADILVASNRATFGQPEIRLGFFAPVGVAWLSARIGLARAIEVTSTGRTYTAAEMQAMGLVSCVVPEAGLPAAVDRVLGDLRRASPLVLRMNVRLSRQLYGRSFEEARLEAERVFLSELMATEDVREGIASFFEKRRPAWKNR
ncbi:MAG: enoyl-CoA hydratase/isomerase family protein [Gemmatimonadota bacterium]